MMREENRRYSALCRHETRELTYYIAFAVMAEQFTKLGIEHNTEDRVLETRLCLCSIDHVVANLCLIRVERRANVVDRSDTIE